MSAKRQKLAETPMASAVFARKPGRAEPGSLTGVHARRPRNAEILRSRGLGAPREAM